MSGRTSIEGSVRLVIPYFSIRLSSSDIHEIRIPSVMLSEGGHKRPSPLIFVASMQEFAAVADHVACSFFYTSVPPGHFSHGYTSGRA